MPSQKSTHAESLSLVCKQKGAVHSDGAATAIQPTGAAILVVENSPEVRHSLEWLLRAEGYVVVTAIHGPDALRKLRAGLRPCLILLDVEMPETDGVQFRQAQLQDPQLANIPVVVGSALVDSEILATQITATSHLGKLFDLEAVLRLVEAHCRRRLSTKALQAQPQPRGGR